jgi:hypothetical protein
MPDFSNLSLSGVVGLLVIIGTIDVVGSMAIAIAAKNFSLEYATNYLVSHVAKVWFPILGLALVGHGIVALDIPAIPLATAGAAASLLAYGAATIGSLKGSFDDKSSAPS